MESGSYVEKSQVLIKLQQICGSEYMLGGNTVIVLLNNILRQFTKIKDWVNVRLGKFDLKNSSIYLSEMK